MPMFAFVHACFDKRHMLLLFSRESLTLSRFVENDNYANN